MATINVYGKWHDKLENNGRVRVLYEREAFVQVGVQCATSDPQADGHPTYDANGGEWCDLDRDGINSLIRALREARDRAYGKDE